MTPGHVSNIDAIVRRRRHRQHRGVKTREASKPHVSRVDGKLAKGEVLHDNNRAKDGRMDNPDALLSRMSAEIVRQPMRHHGEQSMF